MNRDTIVELNQDIGCYLLRFIDGLDATNFIEAVNNTNQFSSIAKTLDHHFIELFKGFCGHQRILLPRVLFESFTEDYEIDDTRLRLVSKYYSDVIEPSERLYVHPCFSTSGFAKLCEVYKTSLFECYSRLVPLNNVWYSADFDLLNYESYVHTIGSERLLNDHEKKLFKVNTYFSEQPGRTSDLHPMFVSTMKEFKQNLIVRFSSNLWMAAIDFSKWALVGGCVLNALCQSPFPDTSEQDINLVYCIDDILAFTTAVNVAISRLNQSILTNINTGIKMEKIPGTPSYNVFLPCNVRLNFTWMPIRNSKAPLSHILHNFDMDICQVAFNGKYIHISERFLKHTYILGHRIVSTFAFLQALATKSFISYTLYARSPKHLCDRIQKYCNRGFKLLEPVDFDGNFDELMAQEEIPPYRIEQHQYIDDDGDIQTVQKEFRRPFLDNIDTFQLQEKFIDMICPELLRCK
ncbi:unnamed protein product [Adineta ricciae]|uniref:Uncharacterized protein n=1 Tax=Adineta ricciae TaxID=249248 RepID=A0A815Y8I9_ADIRI|nr:unnamed protein product [Adineta ricciae]